MNLFPFEVNTFCKYAGVVYRVIDRSGEELTLHRDDLDITIKANTTGGMISELNDEEVKKIFVSKSGDIKNARTNNNSRRVE